MSADKLRIDKWLWYARFFKTRTLAAAKANGGHIRLNSGKIAKASAMVQIGDVLTFPQGTHIRLIRIDALATRRGPAPEAQAIYTDLDPPKPKTETAVPKSPQFEGKGRPTGRDRRKLDLKRGQHLE